MWDQADIDPASEGILKTMRPTRAVTRRPLPSSPFNNPAPPPPVEVYEVDDRVSHDQYGMGRVVGVEKDLAVLVDFGSRQVRITTPYAKLMKL